ncbi:hypothetical protein BKA67DRAFT_652599 [Truncatella angustata]|uniref:Uncharacterized protein n=1 Tax=Truncatella angustata TaxID=152316 RepID=A0A9P8UVX8_9PEZI|nr:uncharacterized protein BKA67DRAFT_652599 [Truncatella angustata]KAH6659368.1 hypothetical protein BKA67DRAFT_652599 [Truncatella angustata]
MSANYINNYWAQKQHSVATAYPTATPISVSPLGLQIALGQTDAFAMTIILVMIYWIFGSFSLSVLMNEPKSFLSNLAPQIKNKRSYLFHVLALLICFPILALLWPVLLAVELYRATQKQRDEDGTEDAVRACLLDGTLRPLPYLDDQNQQSWIINAHGDEMIAQLT